MKTYEELLNGYKLIIWDGKSDIKCPAGVFSADEIRKHWNVGYGTEVFYIVKGRNKTVASFYGTNLSSNYDTEDVLECGKFTVKELVENEFRSNLLPDEQFVECNSELIEINLLVINQNTM